MLRQRGKKNCMTEQNPRRGTSRAVAAVEAAIQIWVGAIGHANSRMYPQSNAPPGFANLHRVQQVPAALICDNL